MQIRVLLVSACVCALALPALAQQPPLTQAERDAAVARLRSQLETPYKRWLDEEVRWIIADQERAAFGQLQTDDERQRFIEQFWLRRDPTPDTEANELREEHYRRIAWVNDRFSSQIPGWKTDRGMVYIRFGAPDDREVRQGTADSIPSERWVYRSLEGIGQNVVIEFVDPSQTNEYRMTWDAAEKDRLLRVPGAGLTIYEQLRLRDQN